MAITHSPKMFNSWDEEEFRASVNVRSESSNIQYINAIRGQIAAIDAQDPGASEQIEQLQHTLQAHLQEVTEIGY